MGLGVFAARKVEDDGWAPAKVLPPRIADIHNVEQPADADGRPLERLARRRLLAPSPPASSPARSLSARRVGSSGWPSFLTVRAIIWLLTKKSSLSSVSVFCHLAVGVDILRRLQSGVGVVFAHFLELPLVVLDLAA